MLSKKEEQRLAAFLAITRVDLEKDVKYASEYYVSDVRWLSVKLKETNEELKIVQSEIDRNNEIPQQTEGWYNS